MKFEYLTKNHKGISKYLQEENFIKISPKLDIVISCIVNEFENKNIMIIAEDRKTIENIKLSINNALHNPEFGLYPFEIDFIPRDLVHKKIEFLKNLYTPGRKVIITTLKGLFDPILSEKSIIDLRIEKNKLFPMKNLTDTLIKLGYKREKEILEKGDFAVKGSIIDIFAFSYDYPIRIFYGFEDEIEDIKFFNIENFRTFESINSFVISSSTYYSLDSEKFSSLEKSVLKELKNEDNEFLKDSILEDLKEIKLKENYGTNFYFKYFEKGKNFPFPTLLDKTEDYIKIFIEPIDFGKFFEDSKDIYENARKAGEILKEDLEQIKIAFSTLNKGKVIHLQGVPDENTIEIPITEIPENFVFLTSIKDYILSMLKEKSVIFATTERQRIEEILKLYEISFSNTLSKNRDVYVVDAFFSKGVEGDSAVILSDRELFIHFEPEKHKPRIISSKNITTPEELSIGDLVVHRDFGIGIFRGLTKLDNNGVKEYLLIEYRDGEKLYVPLERIGFVEKYVGDRNLINLNRLSGNEWKNAKEKAIENAKMLARKLLIIEAERKLKGGFPFKPFPKEEQILALSFPYELTEDQQKALEEVYQDMEKEMPMDRLICGDVGYGKTEIAVRAAFRAVLNGKQVAVLVPTTILALQHERTFQERLKYFPIEIASLSRLTDKKNESIILKRLKDGKIDIIIGTHRLFSKDINFKDLGLLIIDEEQKFGVKHKEKIKEIKSNIDVLTLTATPIPRTLNSALLTLKPVSLIATAPPGRIPVKTYVLPFNEVIMKNAIEFELKRGGQVFIVHNTIESLFHFARRIQELFPKAYIGVAHGKMNKDAIEETMLDFYEGKINILVSTTIIENGLDIPTVNTLIVDKAENFGLAQMYQLRGRIGRSYTNSFAYFFYSPRTSLKTIAEERLETIKEFSGSGAGIKIAMKDLEIRGAGNLLGKEQHGHIISVGYNMYISLLEKAVSEIKGEKETKSIEVRVNLNESYYIPEWYIQLNSERISYYRRITNANSISEIENIKEELEDRFGEVPREMENLLKVGLIMRISKDIGVKEVFQEGKRVFLVVQEENTITTFGIERIFKYNDSVKFGKDYISFEVRSATLLEVLKVLNLLSEKENEKVDN